MPARLIAIGDIHGCSAALRTILDAIEPQSDDTIVTLGDYIDRGPDSRGVIDCLLQLQSSCNLVPLLGNHDEMLIDIYNGREDLLGDWLLFGGEATLSSYGTSKPEKIPQNHIEFLEDCLLYHETEKYIFLHATYDPALPLERQTVQMLLWNKIRPTPPGPHCSGKTVIVGHTAQRNGEILDLGYLKCIDTCCYGEGFLTALDMQSGQIWQADKTGRMRDN
jgi:serine/threonine protein phosphatase 1